MNPAKKEKEDSVNKEQNVERKLVNTVQPEQNESSTFDLVDQALNETEEASIFELSDEVDQEYKAAEEDSVDQQTDSKEKNDKDDTQAEQNQTEEKEDKSKAEKQDEQSDTKESEEKAEKDNADGVEEDSTSTKIPDSILEKVKKLNPELDTSKTEDVEKAVEDLFTTATQAKDLEEQLKQTNEANKAFNELLSSSTEFQDVAKYMYQNDATIEEALTALSIEPAIDMEKLKKEDPDRYIALVEQRKKAEERRKAQQEQTAVDIEKFNAHQQKTLEKVYQKVNLMHLLKSSIQRLKISIKDC